jgi:hypothetical protein
VLRPDALSSLPLNDRTVTGLMVLAPGMLVTPASGGVPGQISSLGARPNTNRYTVAGVSANNAVAGGGWPSVLPGSRLPSMTALGTTHDLAIFGLGRRGSHRATRVRSCGRPRTRRQHFHQHNSGNWPVPRFAILRRPAPNLGRR